MNDKNLLLAVAGIGAYLLFMRPAVTGQTIQARAPGQARRPAPPVNQNGYDARQSALYGAAGGLINRLFADTPITGIFKKVKTPTTGDFARMDRAAYVEPVGPEAPTTGDFARLDRASGGAYDYGIDDGAAVNVSPSMAYDNFDYQGL